MQTEQSQRDEYNRWDDYDTALARDGYYIPQLTGSALVTRLHGGERVLDVGCGTGLVGAAMAEASWTGTLVGTDIAEKRLAQARARRPYAAAVHASAYRLPIADNSFDAVVSAGMVGLTGVTSLYEMARVLRPGGLLVVSVAHIERRVVSRQRYRRATQLMPRWTGMSLLLQEDLGTGYVPDYDGEHFVLFVLSKQVRDAAA